MSDFFNNKDKGSAELAVKQSLESIDANIKWIKDHAPKVVAWLESFLAAVAPAVHVKRVQATLYDEMDKYGRP